MRNITAAIVFLVATGCNNDENSQMAIREDRPQDGLMESSQVANTAASPSSASELTRDDAATMIAPRVVTPITAQMDHSVGSEDHLSQNRHFYERFEKGGLIVYKDSSDQWGPRIEGTPTAKAAQFGAGPCEHNPEGCTRLLIGNIVLDSVTGIRDINPTTKQVEVSLRYEPNEIAEYFPGDMKSAYQRASTLTVTFSKYDDGWRMS